MGIFRRLWCYAFLAEPGSWFVPFIMIWAGTALALKNLGLQGFVSPLRSPGALLILLLFLAAMNILEKSLTQVFRGTGPSERFMASVSIFEAILVASLLIILGFQIAHYYKDRFLYITISVFLVFVIFYLPPFSLKNRGMVSSIFQAFLFGFVIPAWGAAQFKSFPHVANIYIGIIFSNYLFGVYLMRDYVHSLRAEPKGMEKELFARINKADFAFVALLITLPFLFLPLGIYLHILKCNVYAITGLGLFLFLYGSLVLIRLLRKKEIGRGEVGKIQFHLHLILVIAVIFLVTF